MAKNRNTTAIDPLTIAAAVYPKTKRRTRGMGPKSRDYRNANGNKSAMPALFMLNHLRQPVHNELKHVYLTDATAAALRDIADKFHARGMICGSPNKVLSVVVNTPQFDNLLQKIANQMLSYIDGGAPRFEFEATGTHEEVDGDTETEAAKEG